MKKNDFPKNRLYQAGACVLVIGSVALADDSDAATATATATASVLESVSVRIIVPQPSEPAVVVPAEVGTIPALSGTIFTIESFTGSLSPSGPLLRIRSPPGEVVTNAQVLSGAGGAGAPSAANSATVIVKRNADGSLSVSGGTGLTFAVSQPDAGAVIVEYN
ncbi:MAG: hypothetical protein ACYCZT_12485 [Thiobacillus sp.]